MRVDEDQIRSLCRELLDKGWPAYVTTIDKNDYPQTRAMFNLRNREKYPKLIPIFAEHSDDFMILFSTNTSSTKLEDIRRKSAASVYFCIPDKTQGAMFGGDFEIVEDMNLKKALWHEGWERYYPEGVEDPDYTVLRMFPTKAKGWTGQSTFILELSDVK